MEPEFLIPCIHKNPPLEPVFSQSFRGSQSYFATDGVSQSILALSYSGTHNQISVVVRTVAVLFVVGRSLCREDGSIL